MKKIISIILVALLVFTMTVTVLAKSERATIGINVVLNTEVSDDALNELGAHGRVLDVMYDINALTMRISVSELETIQGLSCVKSANPDAERKGAPIDTVDVDSFADGFTTWNLDAINVTDRDVMTYGEGVYVAVLDTGLLDSWRQYFPEERIAEEYAAAFGGGGGEKGNVSFLPNKWEHDQDSHGTHVTSTILGYQMNGSIITGVAPKATIIPVKVLNQNGSGWSSVIARGINYITSLKQGPLANSPVVINMSLGGSVLDGVEQAAIDNAIKAGVIIVASAGNSGEVGMGYPGAYEPVISVAASGWVGEWASGRTWWVSSDVAEPIDANDFYITDFSSRALEGQDLDIAAPGSWIVGAYQVNSGQLGYYFLGGTSMASPHVAGVVALMAEKNNSLTASEAEIILENTAVKLDAGDRTVLAGPNGPEIVISWGEDATGSGLMDAIAAIDAVSAE